MYDRQSSLNLVLPKVLIVGCGGIGSWVALDLALAGVTDISIIDFDVVEESNLNRTPFKICDIGLKKVEAISKIIFERRTIKLQTFDKKIEDISELNLEQFRDYCIVDCRDTVFDLPLGLKPKILCGYDGLNVTIHINPTKDKVFGDDGPIRYRVVPSFVAPPQFLASLITLYLCSPECNLDVEKIMSFNMNNIFRRL